MFFIENIIINLLLINFFLPLAFLSKRFFFINFPFLLTVLFVFFIFLSINFNISLEINNLWWIFLIIIGFDFNITFNFWEWWFVLIFILISLNLLISGFLFNFLGLFIILEVQAIIFLILVQGDTFSLIGIESSGKWAIFNAIFSLFLMTGFVLVYFATGTINFVDIYFLGLNNDFYLNLGLILLFSSLLFKVALPPFQFWLPDVYEAGNFILIIILIGPIKLFYLIFISYLIIIQPSIATPLSFFSFLSIVLGFFLSLNQLNIKKFLAWTGIFYFGVFLLILSNLNLENQMILKLYTIIYIYSSYLLMSYSKTGLTKLTDIMLIVNDNFFSGIALLSVIIIILGLPIISGFWGKLIFYYSLINSFQNYIFVLFILFLTSFAFYYYLSILIYGLNYKVNLNDIILLDSYIIKNNVLIFIVLILNILLFIFPYKFSILFLYLS